MPGLLLVTLFAVWIFCSHLQMNGYPALRRDPGAGLGLFAINGLNSCFWGHGGYSDSCRVLWPPRSPVAPWRTSEEDSSCVPPTSFLHSLRFAWPKCFKSVQKALQPNRNPIWDEALRWLSLWFVPVPREGLSSHFSVTARRQCPSS